jgi:hypothetical protein
VSPDAPTNPFNVVQRLHSPGATAVCATAVVDQAIHAPAIAANRIIRRIGTPSFR